MWTRRDPILSRVQQFVLRGWSTGAIEKDLKPYWHKRLELSSHDGCLLWGNRVVVPAAGQASVLEELHFAHPGATQMKQLARTMVWWSGIDKDIEHTVKSCEECQHHQNLPAAAPIQPWRWPTRQWARVHADGKMLLSRRCTPSKGRSSDPQLRFSDNDLEVSKSTEDDLNSSRFQLCRKHCHSWTSMHILPWIAAHPRTTIKCSTAKTDFLRALQTHSPHLEYLPESELNGH